MLSYCVGALWIAVGGGIGNNFVCAAVLSSDSSKGPDRESTVVGNSSRGRQAATLVEAATHFMVCSL